MTPLPSAASCWMIAVDLELGAHVDAAGRLVEDQQVRVGEHPLGQDDLLLVAAGELADAVVDARRLGAQPLAVLLGDRVLLERVDDAAPARSSTASAATVERLIVSSRFRPSALRSSLT